MRRIWKLKILAILASTLLLAIVTSPASGQAPDESAEPNAVAGTEPGSAALSDVDPTLPVEAVTVPEGEPEISPPPEPLPREFDPVAQIDPAPAQAQADSLAIARAAAEAVSSPSINFAGIASTASPPDPVGDVGPNHYVQMVNATQVQVFDKSGTSLLGPISFAGLWTAPDPCATNLGDPIVIYDQIADRWLLSQFARDATATNFFMCIAISQTADPTADYWTYTFPTPAFPDYPKFGVWPDGYYMSTFESPNLGVYVFDRDSMLTGAAANFIRVTVPDTTPQVGVRTTRILPADIDGPLPAAGTPVPFVRTVDDIQDTANPTERIEIWNAVTDWPAGTLTLTLDQNLVPATYTVMSCNRSGGGIRDCIPQPDTTNTVDALSNRPMMQLKYRTFPDGDAMVFNQTVDVSANIDPALGFTPANEVAGIRWYDLRKSGTNWAISDQGTFAQQPAGVDDESELLHRWMGSAAIDSSGNIAIGYNVVNGDSDDGEEVYPGLRYTGRLAGDPAGTLTQPEQVILDGTTSSTANMRWGDYSAMNVDPVDDCTFWFTGHVAGGATRIAAFDFDDCGVGPITADAGGPYTTEEGADVVLDGSGSTGDDLTYEWDFDGDGVFDDATGPTPTFTPVGQDGEFTVGLRVTNSSGQTSEDTTTVTVTNAAPIVTASTTPADEGSPTTLSATVSDPGWLDPLTAIVDWGDGSALEPVSGELENLRPDATLTIATTHIYGDNGTFTVEVCGSDDDTTVCIETDVTIDNVDPTATIDDSGVVTFAGGSAVVSHIGDPVDFSGRSTDPGSDDLTLSWDWDDGPPSPDVTTAYLNDPPNPDPFPSPDINPRDVTDEQTHIFSDACLYNVTFAAVDDDDGSASDEATVLVFGKSKQIRSAGYWYQQFRQGPAQKIDNATLECYLEMIDFMSAVFSEVRPATTINEAETILRGNRAAKSAEKRLDRQLLSAWLNLANGAVPFDQLVDTDFDKVPDTPFLEAITAAEQVRADANASDADLERWKDVFDAVNNS